MANRKYEPNKHNEIVERESPSDANRLFKELIEFAKLILASVVLMFIVLNYIARPTYVSGNSMIPTLENQQFVIFNCFSGKFLAIHRYDVVVARFEETGEQWVKRVVGLPGDTISYSEGKLTVNGEVVDEPYALTGGVGEVYRKDWDFKPITLGEDEYWLMGDNRNHSADSRVVGAFPRSAIIGNGIFILFPFQDMGIV